MEPFIFLLVALIVIPIAWIISTYNKLIKYKNMIEESWSGIDVALKRRFNLIPNLIAATRGYSKHESDVLTRTAETRSAAGGVASREEEESRISRSLSGIIALAEAYPDLKASTNFLALHNSLDEIEEEIQQARNRYNFSVRKFNTLVESFPSSLIARKFGFERQKFFSLELATQRELPEVNFTESPS
jgi:LemA protein